MSDELPNITERYSSVERIEVTSIHDAEPRYIFLSGPPIDCRNCGAPVGEFEPACSYCKTERA